jgi:hypothetical protein
MKVKVAKTILLLIVLFFVFFAIYMQFYEQEKENIIKEKELKSLSCGIYNEGEIKISKKTIKVEIADDTCKRNLGLSFRKEIFSDEGMFFIFEGEGNYGFWMKDMNFPIDIIWLDKEYNIVHIEERVSCDSYPEIFGKDNISSYVLELQSGFVDKNNIEVGEKIIFYKK